MAPSITARAGGSYQIIGTLSALTRFNTDAAGNRIAGLGARSSAFSVGIAAGAGIAGAVAVSNVQAAQLASLDAGAHVEPTLAGYTPSVVVRAWSGAESTAIARGIGAGLVGGAGASVALATVSGSVKAEIGSNVVIGATGRVGDVAVGARSQDLATADSFAASGGILAGFNVNLAKATVTLGVTGNVGGNAAITARTFDLRAFEDGQASSHANGIALAGGVAGGFSQASSRHGVNVLAATGNGTIDAVNGFTIDATTQRADVSANANATSAALVAGIAVNRADGRSDGSTRALLGSGLHALASNAAAVRVDAASATSVSSNGSGRALGIVGFGSVASTALVTHATTAEIGAFAVIGVAPNPNFEDPGLPVGSIEVEATSSGVASVRSEGAAAGLVASPAVTATIDVRPSARALVGDGAGLYATGTISVISSNQAEGDASLSGKTAGFASFGATTITHSVVQTAESVVGHNAILQGDTISISATGGRDAAPPHDYTATANAAADTIAVANHGLVTGNLVQIGTEGGTFGGLATGRVLPVLAVDGNTLRLGREVQATGVNASRDTITFDLPHFLQTGDKVIYAVPGQAAQSYWVNVLNDRTIKLLDYDPTFPLIGPSRLQGQGFVAGDISAANDTIHIAGHGFANGELVTFHNALTSFTFDVGAVDITPDGTGKFLQTDNNQIYLGNHTFETGDIVTYKVAGGSALGGLANNTNYRVVKIDGNFIQLQPAAGGAVIAISADLAQEGARHSLSLVGAAPAAGLIDNAVYRVTVVDADTIKLVDAAGNVANLSTAGLGVFHIAHDGIDLRPVSGPVQVYMDIIGGGTTTLLAPGGASLETTLLVQGDGVSRVTADGLALGVGAANANAAIVNITSNVRALVLNGSAGSTTEISADNNVFVSATNKAFGSATSSGDAGGLFAFPNSYARTTIHGETKALVGELGVPAAGTVTVWSPTILSINADAQFGAEAAAGGVGGGLVAVNGSNAKAETVYLTQAGFGRDVRANDDFYFPRADLVFIGAHTSHREVSNIRNTSAGLGTGSSAGRGDSGSFADGTNEAVIGTGSIVRSSGPFVISSTITDSRVEANARARGTAAVGGAKATATAHANDQALITLQSGSHIHSDSGVFLDAEISRYTVSTRADAILSALAGTTTARSDNNVTLKAHIDAQDGALVETRTATTSTLTNPALSVTAKVNFALGDRQVHVNADGAVVGPDDEETAGDDNTTRVIDWNADVHMLKDPGQNKTLVVDANYFVTTADGITINGGWGVGYRSVILVPVGGGFIPVPIPISVDNIYSEAVGRAIFHTNDSSGGRAGIIQGTAGTWNIDRGAGSITIINNSGLDLHINNINAVSISTALDPVVYLDVNNAAGFKFDLNNVYENGKFNAVPEVRVQNNTAANVYLDGIIDNPVGRTYIDAYQGSIIQDANHPNALIRTWQLGLYTNYFTGGSIGTYFTGVPEFPDSLYRPIKVQFVVSSGRDPVNNWVQGNGQVCLEVSTSLRDPAGSSPTVNFGSLTSRTASASILFNAASIDTVLPASAPRGITVDANNTSINSSAGIADPAYYRDYYYPSLGGGFSTFDSFAAFGQATGFLAFTTYNIITSGAQHNFHTTSGLVTINYPAAARLAAPAGALATTALAPSEPTVTSKVPILVPQALTATEAPLSTVAGSAETTLFGVTSADTDPVTALGDAQMLDVSLIEQGTRAARQAKPAVLWH